MVSRVGKNDGESFQERENFKLCIRRLKSAPGKYIYAASLI